MRGIKVVFLGIGAFVLLALCFGDGGPTGELLSWVDEARARPPMTPTPAKCFYTEIQGECGGTGQGPTIPCAESPCYTYAEWTQGIQTRCKSVEEGVPGFKDCETGDPCVYHYRAYACEDNKCVITAQQDTSYPTKIACGDSCNPTPIP